MKEPALKSLSILPSDASRPNAGQSQSSEIILMLNLSMAQIELALKDSTGSVSELTDSFTAISRALNVIKEVALQLPGPPGEQTAKTEIESLLGEVGAKIGIAIMAFQFYDRLSQRLTQVSRNLEGLGELVNDPERLNNPNEWLALQQKIRAKYVTEDDKRMFDVLMETRDLQKALAEISRVKHDDHQPEGDIELF